MRKLTDHQKIEIVERYLNGESSTKLAHEYSIARQSILSILKVRKVEIRNGKK
jgi:transposase-like protein